MTTRNHATCNRFFSVQGVRVKCTLLPNISSTTKVKAVSCHHEDGGGGTVAPGTVARYSCDTPFYVGRKSTERENEGTLTCSLKGKIGRAHV